MRGTSFTTLDALRSWCEAAPEGTRLEAQALARILDTITPGTGTTVEPDPATNVPPPMSWRSKLWTVPAEARLGVSELTEALGRPRSWVYARTGNADDPIPHRKLDGVLVFAAGEVRTWIREREEVVHAVPMAPASTARGA